MDQDRSLDAILKGLRMQQLAHSVINKLSAIEEADKNTGGKILLELGKITDVIAAQLTKAFPKDKKGLNKLIADNNGITVEQLIASQNYQILCDEYKKIQSAILNKYLTEIVETINKKVEEFNLDIRISREEIAALLHMMGNT